MMLGDFKKGCRSLATAFFNYFSVGNSGSPNSKKLTPLNRIKLDNASARLQMVYRDALLKCFMRKPPFPYNFGSAKLHYLKKNYPEN